jgi:hypothetical protein
VKPARRLQGAWLLRTCGVIGGWMMADVEFVEGQVIIKIPKAILVMTVDEFRKALKRGKAYRRQQAYLKRVTQEES